MGLMQAQGTDIDPLHRWRTLVPLTGLARVQIQAVCTVAQQRLPPRPGRPWSMPLPVRVLPVLIHLRTNLTTRALAARFTQPIDSGPRHSAPGAGIGSRTAPRTRQQRPAYGSSTAP
jgi:hypothetical protein